MKVLALTNLYPPDLIGGYEVACAQVVDGLRERGHEVQVLTSVPRQPVEPVDHVVRRLRLADEWSPGASGRYPVSHLILHGRSRFIDALNVDELMQTLARFRPEVVYICNLIGIGGLGLLATLQHLGVPWVWQLGDSVPTRLCTGRTGPLPGLVREFNRQVEGTYIAVSSRVLQEIEESGIVLRGKIEKIPNWVVGRRPPARSFSAARSGPLKIMSAGHVHRDKGIDLIIEAVARLRNEHALRVELDIYGNVGDSSLASLATSLELDDRVRFLGALPHARLMERYGEYDVFAFPTREREPFGLVPLEAASRGCVPVITARCGVGEWMVHGVHCLKVERSADAFAETLADLASGRVAIGPLARRAQHAVLQDFHLDAILPRIESILAHSARTRRQPARPPAEVHRLARLAESLADGFAEELARGDTTRMKMPHHLVRLREART